MLMTQMLRSLEGLRVLVVDDEPDIREFVTAIFESYGVVLKTVASAAEAIESLEQFRPEVLLIDIRMPNGNGYDLIRQIRALEAERGWHLPADAITAYLEEDQFLSLKAGYQAHLHKLAPPQEWVAMVAQLAGRA
jgi:CheY-like chemotaxis protein